MKLAVEVFGKGMELHIGWGMFSLQVGRLLDVLYDPEHGARGNRWLDWESHDTGHLEVWLGRRHIGVDWGPDLERSRLASAA